MFMEIVFLWLAIATYAVSAILFIFGVIFEREGITRWAFNAAVLALVPHFVSLGIRWERLGHGPYLGFYEACSTLSIFSVVTFALLTWRQRRFKTAGIAVMPVVVLVVAGTMLAPKGGMEITANLASYWLVIHVVFANLAFGTFVASFALAIAYLVRENSAGGRWAHHLAKLPSQEIVDHMSFQFAAAGFLFWGLMCVSGAIWANESWGRYWGWDPIETWTLVVWLVYAVYLHLRVTMGWRGSRMAWMSIIALPICAFSLLGIPTIFKSIHAGYLAG
jgi:cytochrome c-type biogenesis protein CcsB